jgi:oxygen-independent coproporphyrinogen III oxidase
MAGIYIHIPFCKQRCTYCDFYTEVAPQFIPKLTNSIVKEIEIRKNYLNNSHINTIYFGGGTPSILNKKQFEEIFTAIYSTFSLIENAEITFEANPDDLTIDFLKSMKLLSFNRLSIGIQSFDDADLKRINRRHNSKQAILAVQNAQKSGFENISIDLIYGLPSQTLGKWEKQIEMALNLDIQHISAYGLTYEENTKIFKQRENGVLKVVDDDTMNEMYLLLVNKLKQKGFDAYEISNFAKENFKSRHNSSYWKQESYIGFGPSAHSYNVNSRQWNVASISKYIESIESNSTFYEIENLTINDKYNDYIMVSLRTSEGVDLKYLEQMFGPDFATFCLENSKPFINNNNIQFSNGKLCLTTMGILISNQILIQLIKV